jgi:hypothetical protein
LVLPTAADARLSTEDASEQLALRFRIPEGVSRGYALGFARAKGGMGEEARTCVGWLRVGQDDGLLASEYVVGSGAECEDWSAVLGWAHQAWQHHPELRDVQRASAERYYTVAVSPYSFRHPLYEARAGLPSWTLRAAQTAPQAVPWRCEPRYVREAMEGVKAELAGYACPEGPVAYDHLAAQPLAQTTLGARPAALASFRSWQQALARQYAQDIPSRIERLERLWTRYPESSSP